MKSFSSGEVAKICDVTSRTIIRWIGAGRLNAFKLPGRGNNRVSESDLIAFLHQNNMPVPDAIAPVQEQLCIIVTEDEYLLKHVRRMVRNANFLVSSFSSGIEAGFEIAITKPSLIVLDADLATADPKQISEHIQKLLDYHPHFMVFSSDTSMCLDKQDRAKMTTLSKPLSLNDFAQALDEALLGWA